MFGGLSTGICELIPEGMEGSIWELEAAARCDICIMEGKDWIWDGGILREKFATKTYKSINTLVDQKQLDEKKLDLFNDFLSNI